VAGAGSSNKRYERNRRIVAAHLAGSSQREIGDAVGLSDRQVRNVLKKWREAGATELHDVNPAGLLFELLELTREVASEFAATAREADNTAAKVGALRGRLDALSQQRLILERAGVLEAQVVRVHIDAQVRALAARFVTECREQGVPEGAMRAVLQAITAG